jgi:23S rRNA (uracil1939-C5)-methyltransferase
MKAVSKINAKELIGIECEKAAVENAAANAKLNNIKNARFICTDAGDFPDDIYPDIIILDPARKGCDLVVLEKAASLKPAKIIMVSCDPATAARDCARLAGLGYKTVKVAAVDLFPRTRHVECVAVLSMV